MQGKSELVALLNQVLKNELTAINQYFLHARMLGHWGVTRLGKQERDASIDEMKHADQLIERILFLEGLPNLQDLGKLYIGETVAEVIDCDLRTEMEAMPALRTGVAASEKAADFVTRDLFASILHSEEEHVDFLETQKEMIERMGIQNYIQLNSEPATS